MSLLKKLKGAYEKNKQQRQQQTIKQQALSKEMENARWEGYRKGSIAQARKQGFQKARQTRTGILGNLQGAGTGAFNFMNQDSIFGKPKKQMAKHTQSKKGLTIHVNGTTIHVGSKQKKRTHKKKTSTMFDLGF